MLLTYIGLMYACLCFTPRFQNETNQQGTWSPFVPPCRLFNVGPKDPASTPCNFLDPPPCRLSPYPSRPFLAGVPGFYHSQQVYVDGVFENKDYSDKQEMLGANYYRMINRIRPTFDVFTMYSSPLLLVSQSANSVQMFLESC